MRALVQRIKEASVTVAEVRRTVKGPGMLVFVGVMQGDGEEDVQRLAHKLIHLRIFEDTEGVMNLDVQAVKGEMLVISQFTLCADTRRGHRPSYVAAAAPEAARDLYERLVERLAGSTIVVKRGFFGQHMDIGLVNDGPVTFLLDTRSA